MVAIKTNNAQVIGAEPHVAIAIFRDSADIIRDGVLSRIAALRFIQYTPGEKLKQFHLDEGLEIRAVQSIFEDDMGQIWIGGGGGLYRLAKDKFIHITMAGPWDDC